MENCKEYYSNQVGCNICKENFILFSYSICEPIEVQIPNCDIYQNENTCSKCFAHYYLEINTCVIVPLENVVSNCKYYSSSSEVISFNVISVRNVLIIFIFKIILVLKLKPVIVLNMMTLTIVRLVLWDMVLKQIHQLRPRIVFLLILIYVLKHQLSSLLPVMCVQEDILLMNLMNVNLVQLR